MSNKQTELSKRLRMTAERHPSIPSNMAFQAAEEIERYYIGMLNWKATAEKQNAHCPFCQPSPQPVGAVVADEILAEAIQRGYSHNDGIRMDEFDLQHVVREVRAALASQPAKPAEVGGVASDGKRSDLVPGKMHCARCAFSLLRNKLNLADGEVYAGTNETERCPNGCGPLWPMTWEQEARDGYKLMEELFERATKAEAALAAQTASPQTSGCAGFQGKPVTTCGVCAGKGCDAAPQAVDQAQEALQAQRDADLLRVGFVVNGVCVHLEHVVMFMQDNDPAPEAAQPKLVLALPDYEKRRIVIASDEVIDGERVICCAIQPEAAQAVDEREAFETWAMGANEFVTLIGAEQEGKPWLYFDDKAQDAWIVWQARASLSKGQK
ncbi:MAG: hypothetical protein JO253_04640 [Alphaproteobacteria bacterium]|nr:hypothetical protein [Alphaproteobacteria bacterium]